MPRGAGMKANTKKPNDVFVTFFPDKSARTLSIKRMPIWELRDLILTTSADAKADLPWLKLAVFGNKRSTAGCLRRDENMTATTGLEADYDGEKISFDAAAQTLKQARLQALIYTSPSHTPEKPRWRVLCPFSQKLKPKQRAKMMARLCGLFGDIFSPESFKRSQAYYFGKLNDRSTHHCNYYTGDFIDKRGDLDARAKRTPAKRRSGNVIPIRTNPIDRDLIISALEVIPSDAYWPWLEIGAALYHEFGENGFKLFDRWSAKSKKYRAHQCAAKWAECAKPTKYTGATILFYANEASPGWRSVFEAKQLAKLYSFFRARK